MSFHLPVLHAFLCGTFTKCVVVLSKDVCLVFRFDPFHNLHSGASKVLKYCFVCYIGLHCSALERMAVLEEGTRSCVLQAVSFLYTKGPLGQMRKNFQLLNCFLSSLELTCHGIGIYWSKRCAKYDRGERLSKF